MQSGKLPKRSSALLEAVLYRGKIKRGEVLELLGVSQRTATRVVAELLKSGILASKGPKSPLHLAFPAKLAPEIMPGLFPEA
jgi:Fic family protein